MNKLLFSTTIYDFIVLPAPHNKQIRTKRVNKYYECRDELAKAFSEAWGRWAKKQGAVATPITKPCRMKAIVCRKTRRQADFDNLGKTVSDALTVAQVVKDDSQFYSGEIVKRVGWNRDYIVVSIYEYDEKKKPL